MKKVFTILCSFVLAFALLLAGCGSDPVPAGDPLLRLRSETEQALKVGEGMTIVYTTANTKEGVTFVSSDKEVITVDEYGSVEAVGVGEADVTVALKEAPSVSQKIHFKVTRNFFMQENRYRNGTIDFTNAETGGTVSINDGQAQLLVNSAGQSWFFGCHLKRTGFTNGDTWGRWGVGSFLVNAATPIGEVMLWAGFMNRDADANSCVPYYGGWRTTGGAQEKEVELTASPIAMNAEADVTIIRLGTKHYVIFECGGEVVKTVIDIEKFADKDTFPGVFGQNQIIEVSDYDASNDPEKVLAALDTFQLAEEIEVNGLDARLIAGREYDLTASVFPAITVNKNATWGMETAKEGVTLTPAGHLTIAANVSGEITVRVTAQSGENVTNTRTFTVVAPPASSSSLFETEMHIGESGNLQTEGTTATFSAGENYLPLKASGEKWYVSATVRGAEQKDGVRAGFLSAAAGYTKYFRYGLAGSGGAARHAEYGEGYGETFTLNYAANGDTAHGFASVNTIGLLKDGASCYFFANGKLIARREAAFAGETFPVLYAEGCGVTFSEVTVKTGAEADAVLEGHTFFVGGYVTKAENVYTLSSEDFGEANNMNWPPDNDYVNGLKYAEAIKGDYTVEFTMSAIVPYGSTYDGKVLVYLKSERVTASIQFIVKGNFAYPETYLCINLDDNTWEEYRLPEGIDLLSGETQVKIVKNASGAELWLNNAKITELKTKSGETREADVLMRNNGYWGLNTACTPGIGSFKCGVTIKDPVITKN